MTNIEVIKCLTKVNNSCFWELQKLHRLPPPSHMTLSARVYDVPQHARTLLYSSGNGLSFCGNTDGYTSLVELEELITLDSAVAKPSVGRAAVGAVFDDKTKPSGNVDRNLPVVLALGINYGQQRGHDYLSDPLLGHYDSTGMRPKLENTVYELRGCGVPELEEGEYHLVAANFFPWITAESWRTYDFNAITEQLFVRFFGWPSPIGFAYTLINRLQIESRALPFDESLTHIVIHGAHTSAPHHLSGLLTRLHGPLPKARCLLKDEKRPEQAKEFGPAIIICDNLAFGPVHNAVCFRWPLLSCPVGDVLGLGE